MSIRIRTVNGVRVALCAVETDAMPSGSAADEGDGEQRLWGWEDGLQIKHLRAARAALSEKDNTP